MVILSPRLRRRLSLSADPGTTSGTGDGAPPLLTGSLCARERRHRLRNILRIPGALHTLIEVVSAEQSYLAPVDSRSDFIDLIESVRGATSASSIREIARRTRISEAMLRAILSGRDAPGVDTLALLLAWSPSLQAMIVRGLRRPGKRLIMLESRFSADLVEIAAARTAQRAGVRRR